MRTRRGGENAEGAASVRDREGEVVLGLSLFLSLSLSRVTGVNHAGESREGITRGRVREGEAEVVLDLLDHRIALHGRPPHRLCERGP